MTVLIGIRFEKNVMLMGDCRRSKLDNSGGFLEVDSDEIRKVHKINESTIIAIGGNAAVVDSTISKIKEVSTENMSIQKIVSITKSACKESLKEIFPAYFGFNPFRSKEKKEKAKRIHVSFLVAGINEEKETFLITFNSDNFSPEASGFIVIGDGNKEVLKYINENNFKPDPITCTATAIYNTSKKINLISPNSIAMSVDYAGTKEFRFNTNAKLITK